MSLLLSNVNKSRASSWDQRWDEPGLTGRQEVLTLMCPAAPGRLFHLMDGLLAHPLPVDAPAEGRFRRAAEAAGPIGPVLVTFSALCVAIACGRPLMIAGAPHIALLWPPNAVLAVALAVTPLARWPLLLGVGGAAQLVMSGTSDVSLARLLVMYAANALQSVVAAWVIRIGGGKRALDSLDGASLFMLGGAIMAPLLASMVSAWTQFGAGWIDDLLTNARMRFITNVVTMLTLVPPLLYVAAGRIQWSRRALPSAVQLIAVLVATLATTALAARTTSLIGLPALLLLPLPLLLWSAIRFGLPGLGLSVLAVAVGRFLWPPLVLTASPVADLLSTQLALLSTALPMFFLAVLMTERNQAEATLRESEGRYRLATTAGATGVWDWNLRTGDIYVDPILKSILGYADHEIANRIDVWGSHVHPDDVAEVGQAAADHLAGHTADYQVEHRMLHRDGTFRWFLARGTVSERVNGRPVRLTGTDTDITDRRAAEDAAQRARDALMERTRFAELGELAGSIAHELNQPLCAIIANSSVCNELLDRGREQDVRRILDDVVRDSQRAGEVLQRTRQLIRRQTSERVPVAINQVVRDAVALVRGALARQRVTLRLELAQSLPAVSGDALQLQQLVRNLLANAIDAVSEASDRAPEILLSTRQAENGQVAVTIGDSGPGLGSRGGSAFQPFFTTKAQGLGMGLTVCRSIAEVHGGTLDIVDGPLAGATFEIRLPAA